MLKKFLFIFYLCLTSVGANALPDCDKPESDCVPAPGCEWKGGALGCKSCSENNYYQATTDPTTGTVTAAECKACPEAYPYSDAGSTNGISDCYKPCETIPIYGGKRVPLSDKADYNTQCAYTIQCDNDGGDCDMGFHPDGDNCVPNVQECNGGNGFQFYNNGTFSICYVSSSSCGSNETLIGREYSCNGTPYGECMTNVVPCTIKLNTTTCNGDGTISGNATLNNGTYNLSACECNRTNATITNGKAGQKCFYNTTNNTFDLNCENTVTSCDSGYCSTDGHSCITIPDNYYKNGAKNCEHCPDGSYRSGNETTCYWNSSTVFTDSTGNRFTIPTSGKIYVK